MPKKDLRYYLNTIKLKMQAAAYHLLFQLGFSEHRISRHDGLPV